MPRRKNQMLRALTVNQPWAWAIFHAHKDIENRSWWWRTALGEQIAIHAGKHYDHDGDDFLQRLGLTAPQDLPWGALVGVVTIRDVHHSAACVRTTPLAEHHPDGLYQCSRWAMGGATGHGPMYHWQLAAAHPIDPVPCRGNQQLWTVRPDHAAAVSAALLTEDHGQLPPNPGMIKS